MAITAEKLQRALAASTHDPLTFYTDDDGLDRVRLEGLYDLHELAHLVNNPEFIRDDD